MNSLILSGLVLLFASIPMYVAHAALPKELSDGKTGRILTCIEGALTALGAALTILGAVAGPGSV